MAQRTVKWILTAILCLLLAAAWWLWHSRQSVPPPVYTEDRFQMPAKVIGDQIGVYDGNGFVPRFWDGVLLDPSLPGDDPSSAFPSEEDYFRWFQDMKNLHADAVRVTSLLPPHFYEALSVFNAGRRDPLYLIQGIRLSEPSQDETAGCMPGSPGSPAEQACKEKIAAAVRAIHGDLAQPAGLDPAYGEYTIDVSSFVLGFVLEGDWPRAAAEAGRDPAGEPAADEPHQGQYIRALPGAGPLESWLATLLDHAARIDMSYGWQHPVAFNVPLDFGAATTAGTGNRPDARTAVSQAKESAPLQTGGITGSANPANLAASEEWKAGYFAAYSMAPLTSGPAGFPDDPDAAAGYLQALKNNHSALPVLITAYGVPHSRLAIASPPDSGVNPEDGMNTINGTGDVAGRDTNKDTDGNTEWDTDTDTNGDTGGDTGNHSDRNANSDTDGHSNGSTDESPGPQDIHPERIQGEFLVQMREAIREQQFSGAVLYAWMDDWDKSSPETAHLELPVRRAVWRNRLNAGEQYGLIAIESGGSPEESLYVDGKADDWEEHVPVLEALTAKVNASVSHDASDLVIKLEKTEGSWNLAEDELLIAFDTSEGGSPVWNGAPGLIFPAPAEFVLHMNGGTARMLVNAAYDPYLWQYGPELGIQPETRQDTGVFHPWRLRIPNVLPGMDNSADGAGDADAGITDEGAGAGLATVEAGRLIYGNANPDAEDYNSAADWHADGAVLEFRIPWMLLGFMDPSLQMVWAYPEEPQVFEPVPSEGVRMMIYLRPAADAEIPSASKILREAADMAVAENSPAEPDQPAEPVQAAGADGPSFLDITVADAGEQDLQPVILVYTWDKWDVPDYHERKRLSYGMLRQLFEEH